MTEETPETIERELADTPLGAKLGIVLESAQPEQVTGRLPWAEDLCTVGGAMHGGALMALADNLGGLCAYLNLPEGAGTATISSSTNFLHPVRSGQVHGAARPLHVGNTVIVIQTDLRDDTSALVGIVTQAQAVITLT